MDIDLDDYLDASDLGIEPETDEERQQREDWQGQYSLWLDSFRL